MTAPRLTPEERLVREGVDELEPIRFAWLLWYLSAWAVAVVGGLGAFIALGAFRAKEVGTVIGGVGLVALIVVGSISAGKGKKLAAAFDAWRDRVVKLADKAA